jgi:hypothetical protein
VNQTATAEPRRTRPSRGPLARQSLVQELHVSADGRLVPGEPGYFWYGNDYALLTGGDTAAEYLVGGGSVPVAAVVALWAVRDARRWLGERTLGGFLNGAWARSAWAHACHGDALVQHAAMRLGDERAWRLYRGVLQAAVGELSVRW